jgi:hypothetical protein
VVLYLIYFFGIGGLKIILIVGNGGFHDELIEPIQLLLVKFATPDDTDNASA